MAQRKGTISRDSVFRRIGATTEESPRPMQGIPSPTPPTRQTAVWLGDEDVAWLDGHIHEIKRAGWRSINRSIFIRAIIKAAMEQNPDIAGVSGEEELTQRLTVRK